MNVMDFGSWFFLGPLNLYVFEGFLLNKIVVLETLSCLQ